MTDDDETVERVAVWPLIHTLLVQFAPRIAEAEAATTYDERIAIINGVSAHIAKKVEEQIDTRAALSALPADDALEGLRELSERATLGQWDYTDSVVWIPTYDSHGEPVQQKVADTGDEADAAFIAAAVNYVRARLAAQAGER